MIFLLFYFYWRGSAREFFRGAKIKKQSAPSMPKVVHDGRELLLWLIPLLDKIPRNRRYTLGEKLELRLLGILELLVEAAYSKNKRSLLAQANRDLEVCRHLWRLCHDLKCISTNSYEHGGKLMLELGMQIGGWLRTESGT